MKKYLYTYVSNTSSDGIGLIVQTFDSFEKAKTAFLEDRANIAEANNLDPELKLSNEYFDEIGSDQTWCENYWKDIAGVQSIEFHYSNVEDDFYINVVPLP